MHVKDLKRSSEHSIMSKLIVEPEYLSESYLPEKLLHRDKEIAELLGNARNFVSTLVYGPYGSGKSTLVKYVFKSLSGKFVPRYIDCSIYPTTYSVLKEVVPRGPLILARSNYELIKELKREVKDKRFIVCLDGFEKLREKDLIRKLLLLGVTLVLVTDEEENVSLITDDVRSRLGVLRVNPYTSEQVFDILKARAEKALARWSYTDDILREIAEKSKGNMTLALNLLRVAAVKAENVGKRIVEEQDIPETGNSPLELSPDEKVILNILRREKSIPAGKLYELYLRAVKYPKSDRSFRAYMSRLCAKGLVKAYGDKRGRVYEIVEVD